MSRVVFIALALLMSLPAQAAGRLRVAPWPLPVETTAAQPSLDSDGRRGILLSWIEPNADGHRLRFARFDGKRFDAPRTVAEGARWFVNWADFPAVRSIDGSALAAFWLQKSTDQPYAYDVRLVRSVDDGRTWSTPLTVHDDGIAAEHGFASLWRWDNDALAIAWLDGRHGNSEEGHGAMSLRGAVFDADLKKSREWELDARTCDCCQTDVALTQRGPVLVFRDRSVEEIRDVSVTRYDGKEWTPPQVVHADGWKMPGCPVNGPAVAARGNDVVVAWYTAAGDLPRVRLARSHDAGSSFGAPVELAQGDTAGRVDVLAHPDGGWWASWVDARAKATQLWLARFDQDMHETARRVVADLPKGHGSGFPRLAPLHDGVVAVWTDIRNGKPFLAARHITLE
jgi:hypothetical protein